MNNKVNRSFAKFERLTRRHEFSNVFNNCGNNVFKDSVIVALMLPNVQPCSRLGIVVKKILGNAPERNRIKRLFREAFRKNKMHLTHNVDIVIIPRAGKAGKISLRKAEDFMINLIRFVNNGC